MSSWRLTLRHSKISNYRIFESTKRCADLGLFDKNKKHIGPLNHYLVVCVQRRGDDDDDDDDDEDSARNIIALQMLLTERSNLFLNPE